MKKLFLITLLSKFFSKFLKRMLFPTLIIYFSFILKGQELPEIVPPSPTVANLMKFEEVPIDYYSGQPSISIPVFSKQLAQGLDMNIGFNYSTSGVKIDNRSGWTGTSWSLFAGGSISRTVNDVADETKKDDIYNSDNKTGVLHNSDFWNFNNLGNGVQEFLWKSFGSPIDKYDTNLDLYQFNFMGYGGRFVIVKQGGSLVAKLLSKNSNLKISIGYNSTNYHINSFTVTDTKGYKYTFDIVESTDYYTSSESLLQGSGLESSGSASNYVVNSAWHLSKIENSRGDDLATFTYRVAYNETYNSAPNRSQNTINSSNPAITQLGNNQYNQSVMLPKHTVSQSTSTTGVRKLSSILFRDLTSVVFELSNPIVYPNEEHPEISGGKYLSKIFLKDAQSNIYKTYNFDYESVSNRLWLTKLSEIAGSFTLNTNIEYHNKHLLPPFGNGINQGDNWGYYSGINNPSTFNEGQIRTGLLKKITYPTGGFKEFEFEHNSYSFYGNQLIPSGDYMPLNSQQRAGTSITTQEMLGGGVRIKSIKFKESATSPDAKNIIYEYKLENDSNKSSGVIDAKQDQPTRNYNINISRILVDEFETLSTISVPYSVKQWGANMNVQMTKGNYVAYQHVKVSQVESTLNGLENNGYSKYDYTSSYEHPTPSSVFSLPTSTPAPNIDYKRGLLKKQRVYDKSDKILKQVENTHIFPQEDFIYKERAVYKHENAKQFYSSWAFYISSQGFSAEINSTPSALLSYTWAGFTPMFHLTADINAGWAQMTQSITNNYFYDDLDTQSIVTSKKTYDYNSYNYQVATENSFTKENGEDIIYQTIHQYPLGTINGGSKGGNSSTVINRLIALNKVNEVLESETVRYEGSTTIGNGETLSKTYTEYDKINNDNNLILPVKISVGKGITTPDSRIEFHNYDYYGNPLEVSQRNGTKIVYIWGYNETLPVAKIENATYSQVSNHISNIQNKSNLDFDNTIDARNQNGDIIGYSGSEGQLRQTLNSLRTDPNLSDALITTFSYDPSIGVTSITDSNGDTIYYIYDAMNRLDKIRDAYGKIVSKNEYNYKN
jgi:hypothetical protein